MKISTILVLQALKSVYCIHGNILITENIVFMLIEGYLIGKH